MQGRKTHEQQRRILERKSDVPEDRGNAVEEPAHIADRQKRHSEYPVSRRGLNQESDHNKHNDPGQGGHKPQQHTPAEEKR